MLHAFLDFAYLRMDFPDEVMLGAGKFLDAVGLLAELIDEFVLGGGDAVHPPEADAPADGANKGHPEGKVIEVHSRSIG